MALIKCSECGREISDKAQVCPHCGAPVVRTIICSECRRQLKETNRVCPDCGCPNPEYKSQNTTSQDFRYRQPMADKDGVFDNGPSGKSRGVAALLAILLGGLGVHFFYVGKTGAGVLNLLLTLVGWILFFIPPLVVFVLSLIQGILMFSMSQDEFERKYVYGTVFYPI